MSIGGLVARAALSLTPWGRVLSAFRWVAENWKAIAIAVAFAVLGFLYISSLGDGRHWRKESDRYQGLFRDEKAAFKQTEANYRLATAEAQAADTTHAITVERGQTKISQERTATYESRLSDLGRRHASERLRSNPGASAADPGSSSAPGLSEVPGSAAAADAAPSASDLQFNCEANSIQLEELQRWILEQKSLADEANPDSE